MARRPGDDYEPPTDRQVRALDRSWFIAPPYGWIHPVTRRHGWQPDPLLLAFGQYVKRARYFSDLSQTELAKASDVDQGAISRLERALAPAMKIERVVKLAGAMGRAFPLGYCPHEHWCQWQRAPDKAPEPPRRLTWDEMQIAYGLQPRSEPERSVEELDEPFFDIPPIIRNRT